jgi:predicted transposase YbfD/YdcC
MECTAGSKSLKSVRAQERAALLEDVALTSLQGMWTAVPDPRSRHGRRYALSFLLTCLVAALVCDCNSLDAVGQWCREHRALLEEVFGPRRHLTPTGSLYRKLLPRLNAAAVEAVVGTWVQATLHAPADEPLAADGKTVRGAATAEAAAPHLLSVSTMHSQETLLQVRVDEKTNEIPVLQAVLPLLPVAGRMVMADALHTQVATAQQIVDQGGAYVLTVKKNQPDLYAALALFFAQPTAPLAEDRTVDYAHGRREERVLRTSEELNHYLGERWPAVAQVGQLTRTVRTKESTTQEVVYLLASASPVAAPPARLSGLVRAYWGIENKRHYVRDVTFGEDRSRLRRGDAPQILACLRNLAITLLHRTGHTAMAAGRRHFAAQPGEALTLLVSPPLLPA